MAMSNNQLLQSIAPQPMSPTDRQWRGTADHPAPNCPRCASTRTKFCYYNNYSLSQPRYFCKGCRRYWTRGGSLRNVPVGGGCRKARRSRSNKSHSSHRGLAPPPTLDEDSGGPNIDMALVFANFLNQQDHNSNTTPEGSNESLASGSNGLENGVQITQGEDHQGFSTPELASFDDIIEDVLWSDESDLSTLRWQTVDQLQDFDSTLSGSTNLLTCDNWSFFDNIGLDVFSKP